MTVSFTLNGRPQTVDVDGNTPLLWVLRDDLGLTGRKFGCGQALCGACTVHLDGYPVRSCQTLIEDVEGAEVTTIEGLEGPAAAAVLLVETPKPSDDDIDAAMSGNVCRCATYHRIRSAIHQAADKLEG